MILTDPEAIHCEQVVQRYDRTIYLLRNERTKSWVVAQDMTKTHSGHDPWLPRAAGLDGVIGVGPMTTWNYLFEVERPVASFIIKKLAETTVRLSEKITGKPAIQAMREERKRLEEQQKARNEEPIREMLKDIYTYGIRGKRSVLISKR